MSAFQVDFEGVDPGLLAALEELYRRRWLLESLKAQAEQDRLARAGLLETRAVDGLGEVTRRINSFAYHDWAHKLRSYDCWRDRGFNRYYDGLAPETRVKSRGTRIQVGYNGGEPERLIESPPEYAPKRFRKVYA